ncbi:MAG: hypothetical protein ABJB49_05615 [Nitrospirota bacterium]
MKTNRNLLRLVALLGSVAVGGVAFAIWLGSLRAGNPDPRDWYNAFSVLFARHEPAGLALVAIFAAVTALWLRRGVPALLQSNFPSERRVDALIAILVFFITALGTWAVFQQYALTADENMADFQAQIFLSGHISQEIPAFWQPFWPAIIPTHAVYLSATHSWLSSYLPVYAAIRALFMSVGLEWMTNPALAAVSILALAAVARKVWPNEPWKPALAAGLLAASPQFLITSMTAYAMPAHLALNLVWLWCYCDPSKRRFWLAPFVGVAALGLHQPFFHALFVVPFLVRLVRERRWSASSWFAAIYSIGIVCWYAWWSRFLPANVAVAESLFGLTKATVVIQAMYLSLLLGWMAFPVPLLACLGVAGVRKLPPLLRDAGTSCLLTFGFYLFVKFDQGHGWGDRYFHGTLGCLVLIAVAGWDRLAEKVGQRAAVTFATIGVILALLVQLPLRCFQAESFVRPYAQAATYFRNIDADAVGFDPRLAWYSNDLKRNDPFLLQRPIIISTVWMTKAEAEVLRQRFPRSHLISLEELASFGLATERFR